MNSKLAFAALLLLAPAAAAVAQQAPPVGGPVMVRDQTQSSPRLNPVQARAERLSTRMARQLRLNGYQSARVRAINEDKAAKMAAIERKNAGNQKAIDQQASAVYRERDQELQAVLSTDQYSSYYETRAAYSKYDRDYANSAATAALVNSVQNPTPVRANDATIGPARTKPVSRPAGNLGRNAR
ncbi:hypothetical protein [uncultured Hymenobacter sp.]|uniref:hypothetical protein n=1 Tax=uncultured Hymenobacter sp. TaxID=170016 RepID=UPI0035CBEFB1